MIKELGICNAPGNPTSTPTTLTQEEIMANYKSVLFSFDIDVKDKECDLPLCCIGYINYTSVHIKKCIPLTLPAAPQNIFPRFLLQP